MSHTPDHQDRPHLRNLTQRQRRVRRMYEELLDVVVQLTLGISLSGDTFRVTDHKNLDLGLTLAMDEFSVELLAIVLMGIDHSWKLSGERSAAMLEGKYGKISDIVRAKYEEPTRAALQAFKQRRVNGLTLSDRVWNTSKQLRAMLEKGLYVGIANGTPAREIARDMKRYLWDPDELEDAVRNAPGELELSIRAQGYQEGPGIYRSPMKNSMRMVRTEINGAYRKADAVRWASSPFVIGFTTELSNRHPAYDICDVMAGRVFPTSYQWVGWHPQCLCSKIPVLAPKEEFLRYEDALVNGTADTFRFSGTVDSMPPEFSAYVNRNLQKWQRWRRLPMFLQSY